MAIKIPTMVCRDCGKRSRIGWVAGGDCFVRSHYHVDGACGKWMGLRSSDPIACAACGSRRYRLATVTGRVTATACGPRCLAATGDDCECECGGENHGRG